MPPLLGEQRAEVASIVPRCARRDALALPWALCATPLAGKGDWRTVSIWRHATPLANQHRKIETASPLKNSHRVRHARADTI